MAKAFAQNGADVVIASRKIGAWDGLARGLSANQA
tara:strand:- start:106 stop:210 length:105 start_codon:yes stop_codon:yes gene_type:complete